MKPSRIDAPALRTAKNRITPSRIDDPALLTAEHWIILRLLKAGLRTPAANTKDHNAACVYVLTDIMTSECLLAAGRMLATPGDSSQRPVNRH